ncbi:MAG: hypothetical protein ABIQ44_15380 [Chloroflexia bacterium]
MPFSVAQSSSVFSNLQTRYPCTIGAFSEMPDGERTLSAVLALEQKWIALNSGDEKPEPFHYVATPADLPACSPENYYDVIIAGGGLGLVAGAALARLGLRVLVFDRDRVGSAHREWNISEQELASLVRWQIFTRAELSKTIATRYKRGLIAFHADNTGVPSCPLTTHGVLDTALDAQSVLDLARKRFLALGGTILEHRAFRNLYTSLSGQVASVFELEGGDGPEFYHTRLAIDTMGSVSPIAMGLNDGLPFDGVCPTAGTVMEGLEDDSQTGDVLVSVADVQNSRQLIWEGFPGRSNETTVYLFYYDQTGRTQSRSQGLLDLFEQYFTFLPTYRPMPPGAKHLKPVFGYIPARHGRTGRTAARGLICLGDSAAGQSPLTFCGFGSFVRHIGRVSYLLNYALKHDLLEESDLNLISPHQANLRVAWVFSRFMQPYKNSDPAAVNRLMNIFCKALDRIGPKTTVRFLQDRYTLAEYLRIMLTTARHYPGVFALAVRVLGPSGVVAWMSDLAYFASNELGRASYLVIGPTLWQSMEKLTSRFSPRIALRLRAARTAWQAIR